MEIGVSVRNLTNAGYWGRICSHMRPVVSVSVTGSTEGISGEILSS